MNWDDDRLVELKAHSDAGVRRWRAQEDDAGEPWPLPGGGIGTLWGRPASAKIVGLVTGPGPNGTPNGAFSVKLLQEDGTPDGPARNAFAWSYNDTVGAVCATDLTKCAPMNEVGDYIWVVQGSLILPTPVGRVSGLWVPWPYFRVDCT